jgi:hypothetical protein
MSDLTLPYWFAQDELPGLDFNRQISEPATHDKFPDGAVAIFVDDNFWCVAALPYEQYRDVSVEDIVAELWPGYLVQATFTPDHGTMERRVYDAESAMKAERQRYDHVAKAMVSLRDENDRLKAGRTGLGIRRPTRLEAQNAYFVRQYEHLLTAMAHEGTPREDLKGVCSKCNLLLTDRVHDSKWLEKHDAGYSPDFPWAGQLGNDRDPEDDED